MGFFRKLFGGKSFDELRREADAHFEGKRWGDAKLAYDRALDAGKDAPKDDVEKVRDRIAAARDEIARERIAAGDEMRQLGELELARAEYEGAIDTASSGEIVDRARQLIEDLDSHDVNQAIAQSAAGGPAAQTVEEKWALLTSHWSDAQMEEYDRYGDEARDALIALDEGRAEEGRKALEQILAAHPDARFLWMAVGRSRGATKDEAGALEAFRKALERTEDLDEEVGAKDVRLAAHLSIGRTLDAMGDVEGAVTAYQAAVDEFEDDYRPYLELGRYLRKTGAPAEAAQVLEAALPFVGEARPDLSVAQELGLAHADAGDDEKAVQALEGVIAALVQRRAFDFPPDSTIVLARLHEKAGRKERAADLWARLAQGTDVARRVEFHREAARLLAELGLEDEARRLLQRASALAAQNPDEKKLVDEQLAALGS